MDVIAPINPSDLMAPISISIDHLELLLDTYLVDSTSNSSI